MGFLRATPCLQIQSIEAMLRLRLVDLNSAWVHTLIKAALHHLGELRVLDSGAVCEWKRDLESDWVSQICKVAIDNVNIVRRIFLI